MFGRKPTPPPPEVLTEAAPPVPATKPAGRLADRQRQKFLALVECAVANCGLTPEQQDERDDLLQRKNLNAADFDFLCQKKARANALAAELAKLPTREQATLETVEASKPLSLEAYCARRAIFDAEEARLRARMDAANSVSVQISNLEAKILALETELQYGSWKSPPPPLEPLPQEGRIVENVFGFKGKPEPGDEVKFVF